MIKNSKWNKKIKKWHDRNSRKGQQKKEKRRLHSGSFRIRENHNEKKTNSNRIVYIVPDVFSFVENTEETMQFFTNLVEAIKKNEKRTIFYIDSSNVLRVTVDALIYLIAIVENEKSKILKSHVFTGNFPKDNEARKVYQDSGFTNFVQSKIPVMPESTEKMQIVRGFNNDPVVGKIFCQFVMEKINKQRVDIFPLQVVFIELMSNAFHHAYDKENVLSKQWYIYAEHIDDYVRFVFVDTGYGIANTVKKNFSEKIKEIFGNGVSDGFLLHSTFNGDFRTKTNQKFRGNGLSSVRQKVQEGSFRQFEVISGHGRYSINNSVEDSEEIHYYNYTNSLFGTLFYFDFC